MLTAPLKAGSVLKLDQNSCVFVSSGFLFSSEDKKINGHFVIMHPLEFWGQKLRIAILYVTSTNKELKTVYSIYFLFIRWWSYALMETVIS